MTDDNFPGPLSKEMWDIVGGPSVTRYAPPKPQTNGHSAEDIPPKVSRFSFTPSTETRNENICSINLVPLDDLLNQPDEPVDYLVDHLITTVGTSLWAAKPKVGKSTSLRTICVDLARAGYTVVYLALEESRQDVVDHFRRLGGQGLRNVLVQIGPVAEDGLVTMIGIAEDHKPHFVVVDPLQRLIKAKDLNDYSLVYNALSPYGDIARHYKFHLAFAHHLNKYGDTGDAADAIMASTAIYAAVDCAFLIHKHDGRRTIKTDGAQRGGVNLPETVLLYEEETGRSSLGEALEESEESDYEQKILDALTEIVTDEEGVESEEYPDLPENEIRLRVGGNGGAVSKALRTMADTRDYRVIRSGGGRRGDPYLYSRNRFRKNVSVSGTLYNQNKYSRFSFDVIPKRETRNENVPKGA